MFCPIFWIEDSRIKMVPGFYLSRLYGRWSLRLRGVRGSGIQLGLIEMLSRENDEMVCSVIALYKASEDVQDWTASIHEPYLDYCVAPMRTYCTVLCQNIGLV
jgi:hypothetical protein